MARRLTSKVANKSLGEESEQLIRSLKDHTRISSYEGEATIADDRNGAERKASWLTVWVSIGFAMAEAEASESAE